MSKWFTASMLALNLAKMNVITFIINNSPWYPLSADYDNKYIAESVSTKFIGLQIDDHQN
jgi:hypothetical protein